MMKTATRRPLRIAFVTAHPFPCAREVRIAKMAASLHRREHDCIVFCPPAREPDAAALGAQAFPDGRVVCFPASDRDERPFAAATPHPLSRPWRRWLEECFYAHGIDVVIVRDLRPALPAIRAAHRCGIPAILDLGEHYPGLMRIVRKGFLADLSYRHPRLIEWLERRSVQAADGVWVVCDENAERLRPFARRIDVIGNYPLSTDLPENDACRHRPFPADGSGDSVTIVSFGLINEIRGLELAIDAFRILHRRLPATRLVIFGDGPSRSALEERARLMGLNHAVEFRGFIPPNRRYHAMSEGDVGIIFHRVCELTNHTIPNKLFDYMAVGLPVLATPMRPVSRILAREDCGAITDEHPEDAARVLAELVQDRELRQRMGEAGRLAVRERYSWERQEDLMERALLNITNHVSAGDAT